MIAALPLIYGTLLQNKPFDLWLGMLQYNYNLRSMNLCMSWVVENFVCHPYLYCTWWIGIVLKLWVIVFCFFVHAFLNAWLTGCYYICSCNMDSIIFAALLPLFFFPRHSSSLDSLSNYPYYQPCLLLLPGHITGFSFCPPCSSKIVKLSFN